MGVSNLCRNFRYLGNSHSSYFRVFLCNLSWFSSKEHRILYSYFNANCFHTRIPCDSSTGYSSFSAKTYSIPDFPQGFHSCRWGCGEGHLCIRFYSLPLGHTSCRIYSSSSAGMLVSTRMKSSADDLQIQSVGFKGVRQYLNSKEVFEIIDLVKKDVSDLEDKLDCLNVVLLKSMVIWIFHILTSEKVPILRLFEWIRGSHPELSRDSEICSLVVNNCGRLDDHAALTSILNGFNVEQVCLSPSAFRFLRILSSDKESIIVSVKKLMTTLKNVGGSCETSGIRSMIEMFSVSRSFDVAEYVIGSAGRKVRHYNILVKEMSKKAEFEQAKNLLNQMREAGCDPNTQTYNYIISGLCRSDKISEARQLFEDMENQGASPDSLTYDILIHCLCRHRELDMALPLLDDMASRGIQPRFSTHAAIIKTYFESNKCDEAHEYVVQSSIKHAVSSNVNYSLLAALYDKKCKTVAAQKILKEMMEKGLRPRLKIYTRIHRHLRSLGKQSLASDLKGRFFGLCSCQ